MHTLLVDDHALDDLGVLDGAADSLLHLHKIGVNAAVSISDHRDRFDNELGQFPFRGLSALAGHGGIGNLLEHLQVVGLDVDGDPLQDIICLVSGHAIAMCNDRGVHVLLQETLGILQEFARDHHSRRGTIADLVVLGLGDLDHHLRGGVLDIHLFQDGHTIVCNDDVADGVNKHLVHALRPECRPYSVCHSLCGCNVGCLCVTTTGTLAAFFQNQDWLSSKT